MNNYEFLLQGRKKPTETPVATTTVPTAPTTSPLVKDQPAQPTPKQVTVINRTTVKPQQTVKPSPLPETKLEPQKEEKRKAGNDEMMKRGKDEKMKVPKYNTQLPDDLQLKIRIYAASHQLKDYEVVIAALEKFFK